MVRPDGKFITVRVGKLKTPPARKRKNVLNDYAAGIYHGLLRLFEVAGVKDDQCGAVRRPGFEITAPKAAIQLAVYCGGYGTIAWTMAADLPPSSRTQGTTFAAAAVAIRWPVATDPVNTI